MPPILFHNADYVFLNKPAGLKVHAGPGGGPSVEDFFPELSRRRTGPWLAHRLDADTAGCLLIALRRPALLAAQSAFANGTARKTYWALVRGKPAATQGRVSAPLIKQSTRAGWRMIIDQRGQQAVTDWRVLGGAEGLTWLELTPRTGRTHQIRVHCASMACPILGDAMYGGGEGQLHLLARSLRVGKIFVAAPPPPHMVAALPACGEEETD
jgi:tRNA pseudouridine32 synthase/23S rRNA pseudouridine746 synthase